MGSQLFLLCDCRHDRVNCSGILVDRFTAHRIVALTQLPVVIFSLLLWLSDGPVILALFFMMFGLCSGMPQTALPPSWQSAMAPRIWARFKAVTLPINVLASAGAPIVMGADD